MSSKHQCLSATFARQEKKLRDEDARARKAVEEDLAKALAAARRDGEEKVTAARLKAQADVVRRRKRRQPAPLPKGCSPRDDCPEPPKFINSQDAISKKASADADSARSEAARRRSEARKPLRRRRRASRPLRPRVLVLLFSGGPLKWVWRL